MADTLKETAFRSWLRIIWLENCREHDDFGELPYSMGEYFQKYKYWLKREFKHQHKKDE
jgi:hypothetical protein